MAYSQSLFDTTWKPQRDQATGKSLYDIGREKTQAEGEAERQRRQEALQRNMAQKGMSGSGVELAQNRIQNADIARTTQGNTQAITSGELGAAQSAAESAKGRQIEAELQKNTAEAAASEAERNRTFTSGESALQRTWQSGERQATQTYESGESALQRTWQSTENIANRTWQSIDNDKNRQIQKDELAIKAQGMTNESAALYGYTDSSGNHVMGSMEIAGKKYGLEATTLDMQKDEMYGYTDASGKKISGRYETLSDSGKREADTLYGYENAVTGKHVNGKLENDQMIADIQKRESDQSHDTFYGYTDPQTGQYVKGSGEIAAERFGLDAQSYQDQKNELYGYFDDKTGAFIPGKMSLMSSEDKRSADALYGYIDPTTGVQVPGSLKLQADKNVIEQQGLTLEEAKVKGYTDSNGDHVMGAAELQKYNSDMQKDLLVLAEGLKQGTLRIEDAISDDNKIQEMKANRFYQMGINGETLDPIEADSIIKNDPLAYQSYLMGKTGKSAEDLKKAVDLTNQYRAATIANLDDADFMTTVTKMFASWGVEAAQQDQKNAITQAETQPTAARDVTSEPNGKQVVFNASTSVNGVTLPAGTYTVQKVIGEKRKGAWNGAKQDWLEETGDVTYLVDSQGKKYEAGFTKSSTEQGGNYWDNAFNPLSESFWDHPFGIHW